MHVPGLPSYFLSNFLSFLSNFLSPLRRSKGRRSGAWCWRVEGGMEDGNRSAATRHEDRSSKRAAKWNVCPGAGAAFVLTRRAIKRTCFCFFPPFATTANFSTVGGEEGRGKGGQHGHVDRFGTRENRPPRECPFRGDRPCRKPGMKTHLTRTYGPSTRSSPRSHPRCTVSASPPHPQWAGP